mmetsp:Transcript_15683/g.36785  ORF Transcript_15683/g.36785 Transcript_15683/m.36785 type:complete len:206 (+) Transcript_15683:215-832(+)
MHRTNKLGTAAVVWNVPIGLEAIYQHDIVLAAVLLPALNCCQPIIALNIHAAWHRLQAKEMSSCLDDPRIILDSFDGGGGRAVLMQVQWQRPSTKPHQEHFEVLLLTHDIHCFVPKARRTNLLHHLPHVDKLQRPHVRLTRTAQKVARLRLIRRRGPRCKAGIRSTTLARNLCLCAEIVVTKGQRPGVVGSNEDLHLAAVRIATG